METFIIVMAAISLYYIADGIANAFYSKTLKDELAKKEEEIRILKEKLNRK